MKVLLAFLALTSAFFADVPDFSMRLSRQMIQSLSGLAAGELKHSFWLDLEPASNSFEAGIHLHAVIPFTEIPGTIRINNQDRPFKEMLHPACDRPGEIFEGQACAARTNRDHNQDYKIRVSIPLQAFFPSPDRDELQLTVNSRPQISGCFDADLNRYTQILSEIARVSASLEALYIDTRPWSQLKDTARELTDQLRGLKAVAARFNARSNFYTLPSAVMLRDLLVRAGVRRALEEVLSPTRAELTAFEIRDNLTAEVKIRGISRVFAPFMPELRLQEIRAIRLAQDSAEPLDCLLMQGNIIPAQQGGRE